jgi:hypothetical protein
MGIGIGKFEGSIVDGKYVPPANTLVVWRRGWTNTDPNILASLTFKLDPTVEWNGSNAGDDSNYFGRYASGQNKRVEGMFIEAWPPHGEGEAWAILADILGREPSLQEAIDFSIANKGPLGVGDWLPLTGHASPVSQPVIPTPTPDPVPIPTPSPSPSLDAEIAALKAELATLRSSVHRVPEDIRIYLEFLFDTAGKAQRKRADKATKWLSSVKGVQI